MQQYHNLAQLVLETGVQKSDRTGTGTRSIFGHQMRFDLSKGFPLVTTKKVHMKSIILELLWFLQGNTNNNWLTERGCTIWNEWADENGDLGPVYGAQWRSWPIFKQVEGQPGVYEKHAIDQITQVMDTLRNNPDSRRMIVSAWNVSELDQMALMPCHAFFQFYVTPAQEGGKPKLSCQLYQRSADIFLGVPFNIASYSLLIHMMAQQLDMEVGDFIWTGGDCHIYDNHQEQIKLQLSREFRALPTLKIKRKPESIFDYNLDDFEIEGYDPHPAIKGAVAV